VSQNNETEKFDNPLDTAVSAASRFAIEIAAWVAGPWAAAELAGTWIATIPTLIVLIALPGAFSTIGDKRQVVVAVPGRVRLLIELVLIAVAVSAAFLVWTPIGGVIVAVLAVLMLVTGLPRAKWLLSNRPPDWPLPSNSTQGK
jgi:hypothetical protein